ncbi:MAG: hypothetical protein FJW36_22450 [Acidobacteria bacterium]|nr:hypothetical protein [Acidobacteriota bacterium]
MHDLTTGKQIRLFDQLRAGDLAFDPQSKSLWAIRHSKGLLSLIELPPPYTKPISRFEFPYGTDPFDLDISPDGKLMAAVISDVSGRQKLVTFELERLRNNDATTTLIKDFDFSSAAAFTFSPDGKHLYGTSFYSGASNIFRFDLATKSMEALSNTETGLFWPHMLADGRLLAFEYTSQGFYPVFVQVGKPLDDIAAVKYLGQRVVQKYPVVKSWNMGSGKVIDLAEATTRAGEFKPISRLRGHSLISIIQGYKDQVAYGGRLDLSDGLGLARLKVTATVSPTKSLPLNERAHASAEFNYFGWRATANFNQADFYDLFGPTKTARKGFAGTLGHKRYLRYKTSETLELDSSVAGYVGLDRLPEFQNVRASFDKFITAKVGLNYACVVKTLGAVDDEKGTRWKLNTRSNLVNGNLYPRFYGQLDQGFLTPIRNSPIWVRSSAAKSFGPRTEPFANFFFGGFGNNWVDHQEVSRYRECYSFASVELNQIGATDYARSMVEWNLPPKTLPRLRHHG